MRIPTLTSMTTTPTTGRINPIQVDGISAAAFGAAIGEGLMSLGSGLRAREEEQKRLSKFSAAEQLSDWEFNTKEELANMRRDSPLNDANYYDRANAVIDKNMMLMLDKLPAEHQEEFKARANEASNSLRLGELAFDFTKKDAYYKEGITKELEKQKDAVSKDPKLIEEKRKFLLEQVIGSGLPEAEKVAEIDRINNELEGSAYKAEYRQLKKAPLVGEGNKAAFNYYRNVGVKDIISGAIVGNLAIESGNFSPDIVDGRRSGDNGTAFGAGQWRADRFSNLKRFAAQSGRSHWDMKTQLDFVLHEMQTGSDEGAARAWRLLQNAQTVEEATQIFMQHYERPNADPNINHINKRIKAAKAVLGDTSDASIALEDDPRYSNVHYEDRVAIHNSVDSELAGEAAAENRAKKDEHDSFMNSLYVGLMDGSADGTTIAQARKSGALVDYDEISKAEKILKDRNEAQAGTNYVTTKMQDSSAVWDMKNSDDTKALNAYFKQTGGYEALNKRSPEYSTQLVQMAEMKKVIPPDAMSHLNAMSLSNDWMQQRYALDVLSQMRAVSPEIVNGQMTDEQSKRLAIYESRAGTTPDEELQALLRGPRTQEEISIYEHYTKEAAALLKENYTTDNDIVDKFTGWGVDVSQRPNARYHLAKEYRALFTDFYGRLGSEADADKAAMEQINRYWGATDVGGANVVMKYPPSKVGYDTINGSYAWIRENLEAEGKVKPGEMFELVADRQTEAEVGSGKPVSYSMSVYRDGAWTLVPGRHTFAVTEKQREEQFNYVTSQQQEKEDNRIYVEYQDALMYSYKTGVPVPEELKQQYEEALKRLAPAPKEGTGWKDLIKKGLLSQGNETNPDNRMFTPEMFE